MAYVEYTIALNPSNIGAINPFRYRSYFYDTETGFYFLKTRYYDPAVGRFLNIDSVQYADPEATNGLNLYVYCGNNPVMGYDPTGEDWTDTWWGKALGWIVTSTLVVAAVAMIGVVAVGTVASGGLLGAALVGAGVGILTGVGGSIAVQAQTENVNPWSVALSGTIGGAIGAFSGAMSWGVAQIGQMIGQSIGFALGNVRHIGTGLKIAQTFGLTTSMLMNTGYIAGGLLGGYISGKAANYLANEAVTSIFGTQYTVENPNFIRSALLKLFQWLNPLP